VKLRKYVRAFDVEDTVYKRTSTLGFNGFNPRNCWIQQFETFRCGKFVWGLHKR